MKSIIPYKDIKEYTMYKSESNGSYHFIFNKTDTQFDFYSYDPFNRTSTWYKKAIGYKKEWNQEEYIWIDLDKIYDYDEYEMMKAVFEHEVI